MVMTDRLTGWHRPCHSGDQGRGQGSFYHCQCTRSVSLSLCLSRSHVCLFFFHIFLSHQTSSLVVLFQELESSFVHDVNRATVWWLTWIGLFAQTPSKFHPILKMFYNIFILKCIKMTTLLLYILFSCVFRYPKWFQKCSHTEIQIFVEDNGAFSLVDFLSAMMVIWQGGQQLPWSFTTNIFCSALIERQPWWQILQPVHLKEHSQ